MVVRELLHIFILHCRELVCLGCKRAVIHPVTKMKMDVYVKLSNIESTRVRADVS